MRSRAPAPCSRPSSAGRAEVRLFGAAFGYVHQSQEPLARLSGSRRAQAKVRAFRLARVVREAAVVECPQSFEEPRSHQRSAIRSGADRSRVKGRFCRVNWCESDRPA